MSTLTRRQSVGLVLLTPMWGLPSGVPTDHGVECLDPDQVQQAG